MAELGKHPSHRTRFSWDASTYDEICELCGATDEVPGSWGQLAYPCPNAAKAEEYDHNLRAITGLTISKLQQASVERCEKHWHKLDKWSIAEWCNAMAGEVGEACNFAKKLLRVRDGFTSENKAELELALAKELADVVGYAVVVAAALGVDLGEACRAKFNEISERRGVEDRL